MAEQERVKATFTISKELWRKFRIKATSIDKKYSEILGELIEKYLEK
jgi:hypothetical protein